MTAAYAIDPCGLTEEEMEYEFCLHATPVRGGLQQRQRSLGELLRKPENVNHVSMSTYSLAEDLDKVPKQLVSIEDRIVAGRDEDGYSRLVHYHKRLRRYLPETEELNQQRALLLNSIERMVMKYYYIDLTYISRQVPLSRVRTVHPNLATFTPGLGNTPLVNSTAELAEEGAVGGAPGDRSARSASEVWTETGSTQRPLEPMRNPYTGTIPKASRDILADPVPAPRQPRQPSYNQWLSGFGPGVEDPLNSSRPLANSSSGVGRLTANESEGRFPKQQSQQPSQPTASYARNLFGPTPDSRPLLTQPLPLHPGGSAATSSPAPTIRNQPVNERDMNDYVHVSDIQDYMRACLDQLLRQDANDASVPPKVVDDLAERLANVDLRRDSEMLQISNERPSLKRAPTPPLQLSAPEPWGYPERKNVSFREGFAHQTGRRSVSTEYPSRRETYPDPEPSWNGGRRLPDFRGQPPLMSRRLPHQQCNIIEKWPKFTGDNNAVPVVDFLNQLYILCDSYGISKQDLRMHAHLLFKEGASVWYTTYHDRFDTWDTLERYLRMRYDNPNRDRITREEMKARKHRPNELFSAYLTDMESLAQRLNYKMSDRELFNMVVENMKVSYQRRLALVPIESIEHLAQLCYKFDALEGNLYQPGSGQKPTIHQIDAEGVIDGVEDEQFTGEVCAIHGRFKKLAESAGDNSRSMCWNCRQAGHMWRECDQKKVYFCHICGHAGTTAFKCPNGHLLRTRADEDEKNE